MAIIYKGFSTYNRNKKFSVTDLELIKQDLFNHFNIRRGEKPMNPNFGTIIWDLLFEPMTEDTRKKLADDVKKIVNSDPRVSVEAIHINQYDYGLSVGLELKALQTNELDAMILLFDKNSQTLRRQ